MVTCTVATDGVRLSKVMLMPAMESLNVLPTPRLASANVVVWGVASTSWGNHGAELS